MIPARWEGPFSALHSIAHVNRHFARALLETGRVDLDISDTDPEPGAVLADPRWRCLVNRRAPAHGPGVVVRHRFPPILDACPGSRLVLMQPWEYGFLPQAWIEPVRSNVAEVWCYSRYVEGVYRASGVPEEQTRVVPLGVDEQVFNPDAPPYVPTTEPGAARAQHDRPFVFLFVGGTLHRKGFDLVLRAYRKAFGPGDDVCLLVKDVCTRTVYRGQNFREEALALVDDASAPAAIYVEDDLTEHEMAGVYTAGDCLVAPYRGEGFCLPALEAMACGVPVIVTAGGPTDDFVDDAVGWRLPARTVPLGGSRVGPFECVGPPTVFEVGLDDLVERMRYAAANRDEVARRGAAATQRALEGWTWRHSAESALASLRLLRPDTVSGSDPSFAVSDAVAAAPDANRPTARPAQTTTPLRVVSAAEPRPTVSLCMIVRDEERVLADCLASAAPWFDEMIVVDTGSLDRTPDIARSFGAEVRQFAWVDSFAAARNESLRGACSDFIFWMDADDTLPPETGEAIHQAVATAPAGVIGWVVPVQFVDDGPAGGTRVDHIKLFRNVPGVAFEGRIHEQILPSLRAAGGAIARLDAVVLHSGYDASPGGQAKKRERDEKLLLLDLEDTPDHPFKLFNLGMTEHYSGRHATAIEWLDRSLKFSGPTDSHVRKLYVLKAVSHREMGDRELCLAALEEGLALTPDDPELHFQAALTLTGLGRYGEAKEHYLAVLGKDISGHFSSVDIGILGYKTFHNLGSLCRMMGDNTGATDWLGRAVEATPRFLPSIQELFEAAMSTGDTEAARRAVDLAGAAGPGSVEWAEMTARLVDATRGPAPAEAAMRQAVAQDGSAIGPRLVLARRLLRSERNEEARPHLLSLEQHGVAEAAFYLGVSAIRAGDLAGALAWTRRAADLNPGHADTMRQLESLERALGEQAGSAGAGERAG